MFFILSKILGYLISPLIWIAAALLFALLSKNLKRRTLGLKVGAILLMFFTNPFLFNEVIRPWEIKPVKASSIQNFDVGIVLGGMTFYSHQYERIHFHKGTDRLLQAVDLYTKGKIKKIMISGGSGSMVYKDKEALYLKPFLLSLSIPEKDILIETESKNTRENAMNSAEILKKSGYTNGKYVLITSAFHMRRSMACFEKAGLKTTPYSTDTYSSNRTFYFDNVVIPNIHVIEGWDVLFHEWIGIVIYKLSGYI